MVTTLGDAELKQSRRKHKNISRRGNICKTLNVFLSRHIVSFEAITNLQPGALASVHLPRNMHRRRFLSVQVARED